MTTPVEIAGTAPNSEHHHMAGEGVSLINSGYSSVTATLFISLPAAVALFAT